MPPKWKDNIRYMEGSETKIGPFKLTIHRYVGCPPDMWFASCGYLFSQVELASTDLEQAKIQSVAKLQVLLEDGLRDILE